MVEKLEQIYLIDKNFKFVQRTKDKFIYKYEDKELEQLNILELLFSEEEQRIKKIDIYTFSGLEPIETMHIIRGTDNITEVDYYPNGYENITIDKISQPYSISVYLEFSELDGNNYQEYKEIELVKKGHKKHKVLSQIPLEENYYITKDSRIHYISSNSISKLKRLTEFLVPSIKEIEKRLFNPESIESLENEDDNDQAILEPIDGTYPEQMYIYDRNYNLLGKKSGAIVYQNTEDEIKELEIYFTDDKSKLKEVRLIDYSDSYLEGIKVKSKRRIIRFLVTKDNKINVTLCNRRKEPMIINSHTIDRNNIAARAIISQSNEIEKLEVKIQNQLGTFNLTKSPTKNMEFIDKNNVSYLISSNSFEQFRMFIRYVPFILGALENKLIPVDEEKNPILIKK